MMLIFSRVLTPVPNSVERASYQRCPDMYKIVCLLERECPRRHALGQAARPRVLEPDYDSQIEIEGEMEEMPSPWMRLYLFREVLS